MNTPVADRAGRLIYDRARRGQAISFPDAMIAATALACGLVLVTTNAHHCDIPDLPVQPLHL